VSLALVFEGGGDWEIVESDGTMAVARSSRPSPPGSTLVGTTASTSRPFRLKVRSCRKVDESALPFVIEGRLVDVTRDMKALLPMKST
jgi:hypothetical protein